ncbi:hypothetical protein CUJ84_Chr001236 [Rhizobium leguminosarum]|uniref:Uncharacterized protein n=1 Tax=Rhizobium leguminosarum TaxID=384 RepID=A0A2K9Z077_RHILE|nr:hypothetical protein CUJ84_Chr001236 [Rhizobium leguminosarum]
MSIVGFWQGIMFAYSARLATKKSLCLEQENRLRESPPALKPPAGGESGSVHVRLRFRQS